MSYIVKNCPAYDYDKEWDYHICKQPLVPYECNVDDCPKCSDCVIKQVIEKCKYCYNAEQKSRYKTNGYMLADTILQLFDIEEINK